MSKITDPAILKAFVQHTVAATPVIDIHTHLFPEQFADLSLKGIDELLQYHYLVAEVLKHGKVSPEAYWALSDSKKAELIWQTLFVENSPLSSATMGVVKCLQGFGLDPAASLESHRAFFAEMSVEEHVNKIFKVSRVQSCVMTNDPFDRIEREFWLSEDCFARLDSRFKTVLRLDPLLNYTSEAVAQLNEDGYQVSAAYNAHDRGEVAGFLEDWVDRIDPLYVAASVPPDFSSMLPILQHSVIPICKSKRRPLALMIGVERQVNSHLKLAGDGVGLANLETLTTILQTNPDLPVLCTVLARENQHQLAILARKFPNLHVFGCWWFVNVPELTHEITAMRLELLGLTFTPQHSDARVLDQLIYKWSDNREMLTNVLTEKYLQLLKLDWPVRESQVQADVKRLLGHGAMDFIQRYQAGC